MPKIEFLESSAGSAREVDVPEGGALVDVCDDHAAPVDFSCRACSCATCHIEVREGIHLLEPPETDELELLDVLAGPEGARLACQVRVKAGQGTVVIRALD